jgi:hypothetical protein
MTAIGNIYGSGINTSALNGLMFPGQAAGTTDSDGDNGGSRGVRGAGAGGMFASALIRALSQLGVPAPPAASGVAGASTSTNSSTGGTASTAQDAKAAMRQFMHDLFAALQGAGNQGASNTSADTDGDNDGSGARGIGAANTGKGHGPWLSGVEGKLQTLIQQLSTADASTGAGSTDPTIAALKADFQNLVGASGASGNGATLGGFLQSVSQNLQGSNPGLNVSTKA